MPSLYQVTIPSFIKNLKTLSALLEKGLTFTKGDEAPLLNARLIEDMQPLPYQIQRIRQAFFPVETPADTAKGLAVRVGKVENVAWEDNEKTFPELQARLAKTIAFLEAIDPKSFDNKEDAEVILKTGSGELKFTGQSYVVDFAIPNFYFHFVTAYGLLRKEGVPVGKGNYLGRN